MHVDDFSCILPLGGRIVNAFGRSPAVLMAADYLKLFGATVKYRNLTEEGNIEPKGDIYLTSTYGIYTESWCKKYPNTIFCEIFAFDLETDEEGGYFDEVLQATYGIANTSRFPNSKPNVFNDGIISAQSALYAASGIAAAILSSKITPSNRPHIIRIDQAKVGLNSLITFIPNILRNETDIAAGNYHPALSPWNCYETLNGTVFLCAPTDIHWKSLCCAIDKQKYIEWKGLDKAINRIINRNDVDKIIAPWMKSVTSEYCIQHLGQFGIPITSVLSREAAHIDDNIEFRASLNRQYLEVEDETIYAPFLAKRHITQKDSNKKLIEPKWPEPKYNTGPLSGIKVVEIGTNTAAPLPSKQLAMLGADVIKIEALTGDPIRNSIPLTRDKVSHLFHLSNENKRSIRLNLAHDADNGVLKGLLTSADILIDNLKPGSLDKLGFDDRKIAELNSKITHVSISGFGHSSKYESKPAYDAIIQAITGSMSTKIEGQQPLKVSISISDLISGQFALLSSILGFLSVQNSASGLHIDISMQESVLRAFQLYHINKPSQKCKFNIAFEKNEYCLHITNINDQPHSKDVNCKASTITSANDFVEKWQLTNKLNSCPDMYTLPMPIEHIPPQKLDNIKIECLNTGDILEIYNK